MSHPLIRRATPRSLAIAGIAGTLMLSAGPVAALSATGAAIEQSCESLVEALSVLAVLDPGCVAAEGTVGAVEQLTAPVTGPVELLMAPVVEQVPGEILSPVLGDPAQADQPAEPGSAPAPAPAPAPASGATNSGGGGQSTGTAGSAGNGSSQDGDGKVEAAGKAPVEVMEPMAPAAEGRVEGSPTLQPTDLGAMGGNIAGISSQTSGVTLQPYDAAPMVSTPSTLPAAPQIAGVPVTTSSPVAALAADAMTLAGDVVLPQTSGQAAMVTMTGLGLLAAGGVVMRRRNETLTLASLDSDIF